MSSKLRDHTIINHVILGKILYLVSLLHLHVGRNDGGVFQMRN